MKNSDDFVALMEENELLFAKDYRNEFNRLLVEFKDDNNSNEEFGGEFPRMAHISYMCSINTMMSVLRNYHDWSEQK